jgi:hypothetical protein
LPLDHCRGKRGDAGWRQPLAAIHADLTIDNVRL